MTKEVFKMVVSISDMSKEQIRTFWPSEAWPANCVPVCAVYDFGSVYCGILFASKLDRKRWSVGLNGVLKACPEATAMDIIEACPGPKHTVDVDTSRPAVRTCPVCGKNYSGFPAISRQDNKTEICPGCGGREAVEAYETAIRAKEAKNVPGTH